MNESLTRYLMRATNPAEAHHEWWVRNGGHGTGRWSQKTWAAAVKWVIDTQLTWDALTEAEAIYELRLGDESVFYPLFADDPRVWVDCPRDGRTTVGADAICDRCLFDFSKE